MFDPVLFPNDTNLVEADLYKGGIFLGCEFGMIALIVWGIGILASGKYLGFYFIILQRKQL